MAFNGRLTTSEEACVSVSPLDDSATLSVLTNLHELLESSYGCHGYTKAMHNNTGGHVTVTSSCQRILSTMSVSKPIIKLITTAVMTHLTSHCDGGHIASLTALYLINQTIKYDINRRLASDIYDLLLTASLDHLNSCKVTIDPSHIDDLLVLIKTVISSKPGCCLSSGDANTFCRLILEAVISGTSSEQCIQYLMRPGLHPSETSLQTGILLPAPQYTTYKAHTLLNSSLLTTPYRVALISTSLSGDSGDYVDATYEVAVDRNTNDITLDIIYRLIDRLASCNVRVVLAQKVIHPQVKHRLKEFDILFFDRLGLENIAAAHHLCGGKLICSLNSETLSEHDHGKLKEIQHKVIDEKSYVHLKGCGDGSSVCTMVLCHWSEAALEEIKYVCKTCDHHVRQVLLSPYLLRGGGQWQTTLAEYLRQSSASLIEDLSEKLGCSRLACQSAMEIFCSSLERQAALLTKHSSFSEVHCKTESDALLDSYAAYVSALKIGVNIASSVLTIHTSVQQM